MSQHSPTPWVLKAHGAVFSIDGDYVCDFGIGQYEDKKANASFMVRAVNCHDELIAACKAAEAFIGGDGDPVEQAIVLRALDAIIAKATN